MSTITRTMCAGALALLVQTGASAPAAAQDMREVEFSLDWTLQGNHAIWALAQENGYFEDEGLDVSMDRGFGSGDTIVKVAAGTYDIGFADINAIVKFNGENPDDPVIGVYQVFDRTLNAIIALGDSGIETPQDLEGRTLGAPEGDSSRLMFPAFAQANGVDADSVSWTTMAPNMRESMLAQERVEAISGFVSTSLFNLEGIGVGEDDVVVMPYAENGLDLYGSTLFVRKDYAEENPDVIESFIRATIRGTKAAIADPDAGMAALQAMDDLFEVELEKKRFDLVLDMAMLTENVRELGFGGVDEERMQRSIDVAAEAYDLAEPPSPENVYSTEFLPPREERMPD